VFGLLFTAVALILGPAIYRGLGGTGPVLDAALTYSGFVFVGAVPSWIVSLLAAALRGAGNVKFPAIVTLTSAAVLVLLSPAMIFGIGPIPRLGIAGAGVAVTSFNVVAAIVLLRYLASGRAVPVLRRTRLEARLFRSILGVGLLSALGTVQFNLTVLLVTGAVGLFGTDALMAAAVAEAIGVFVAMFPTAWLGLFSSDPNVLATGARYLQIVGPFYGAMGLGMLLYFASQGAGRVLWPVLAGTARLVIAALFGWLGVAWLGFGEPALFALVAVAAAAFGAVNAASMLLGAWGRGAK
jgi:Na+-driven multidrug efflux pump